MKRKTVIHQIISLTLHLSATVLISACTAPTLSQFEVQRPSRITMPREVKKVFIREDLITANNDKLGIKSQVLQELAKLLNSMGRFKVSVVKSLDEKQIEAEKETVAVIQGEVISGGEVDRGQFTDLATCTGGIGGRISSAAAAAINEEAITLDNWRGYVCRRGAFTSDVTELALSSAFAMAGLGEALPPKNQVVRIYKYKNLSLFAQSNFSFTIIGLERETLAIRADSANFGRSITEKGSYRNIKESHLISLTLGSLISSIRIPIFPIPSRDPFNLQLPPSISSKTLQNASRSTTKQETNHTQQEECYFRVNQFESQSNTGQATKVMRKLRELSIHYKKYSGYSAEYRSGNKANYFFFSKEHKNLMVYTSIIKKGEEKIRIELSGIKFIN